MNDLPVGARYPVDQVPKASRRYRILIYGKRKAHTRITSHFVRGFRQNGHAVLWLHPSKIISRLGTRIGEAYILWRTRRFRPDMVLVYKTAIWPELLDELPAGTRTATLTADLFGEAEPSFLELARRSSVLFVTARGERPKYLDIGVPRVEFIRKGCDPTDHFPTGPAPRYAGEIAFIGTAFGDERLEVLRAIAERFPLTLYGEGWNEKLGLTPRRKDVFPREYRKICASTRILIGVDKRHDIDAYFSNRTWLTLGCGGFLLTRYVPSIEEFFVNHQHLVWFNSTDECLELIAHYLPRETERRRIAECGSRYVRTYHTFRHATAEMVARVLDEPW